MRTGIWIFTCALACNPTLLRFILWGACSSSDHGVGNSLSGWFLCAFEESLTLFVYSFFFFFGALPPFPFEVHFCRLFRILKTPHASKPPLRRKWTSNRSEVLGSRPFGGCCEPHAGSGGQELRVGPSGHVQVWRWGCKAHFLWALLGLLEMGKQERGAPWTPRHGRQSWPCRSEQSWPTYSHFLLRSRE